VTLILSIIALATTLSGDDCDGNGIADAVEIVRGDQVDCNGNGLIDDCELGAVPYSELQSIAVDAAPRAVLVEDLDDDGLPELVTANEPTRALTLSVLQNLGGRRFERSDLVAAQNARFAGLGAGDVDGDGRRDLALVGGDSLRVFFQKSTGEFATPISLALLERPSALVLADLNRDGLTDFVVSDRRDVLSVLLSRGRDGVSPLVELATGDSPRSPVAADFDGDGDLDLATVNRLSADISVFRQNRDGTFAPAEGVDVSAWGLPDRLVAADFDGDGRTDLAVGTPEAVVVLPADVEGHFPTARAFALQSARVNPSFSRALVAFDHDGDGDIDLVAGRENPLGIAYLLNDGHGRFAASVMTHSRPFPTWLSTGDVDGDGDPDLAEAVGNADRVRLFWNDDSAAPSFTARTVPMATRPHSIAIGDLDGDSDLDVATCDGGHGVLTLHLGDGRGSLSTQRIFDDIRGQLNSLDAGDYDGDGDLDVAMIDVSSGSIKVYQNDGHAVYERASSHSLRTQPFFITSTDLDGDGLPELVTTNNGNNSVILLRNLGALDFSVGAGISVGAFPRAAAVADLDLDGDSDLAVSSWLDSHVTLLINTGDGSLTARKITNVPLPSHVHAVDADADGDSDLVTVSSSDNNVVLIHNLGELRFTVDRIIHGVPAPNSALSFDVDGNGLPDVVATSEARDLVSILLQRGGNDFELPLHFAVGDGPRFSVAGDLNGDGRDEIISADREASTLTVLFPNADADDTAFLREICTEREFFAVSTSDGDDARRLAKFSLPATAGTPLGPVFQNLRRYPTHQEFLVVEFPELFPALPQEVFFQLFGRRATRSYFAGDVRRLWTESGFVYGFSLLTDPAEFPSLEEIAAVDRTLEAAFQLRPLLYAPHSQAAREQAAQWKNPPFEVLSEDSNVKPPPQGEEQTPVFTLAIPPGAEVCGAFLGRADLGVGVTPGQWYGLKTTVRFIPGEISLPTDGGSFPASLFEEVRVGRDRERLQQDDMGTFRMRKFPGKETTRYRFDFEQNFRRAGGEPYRLRLFNLTFERASQKAPDMQSVEPAETLTLDDEYLTHRLFLEGFGGQSVGYAPCDAELLPLWEIHVELEDDSRLQLLERSEPPPAGQTGPASLVSATIELFGAQRQVTNYEDLIYAAGRHNTEIRYWVVLEPALELAGLASPVYVVDVEHPQEQPVAIAPRVRLLQRDFTPITELEVTAFRRRAAQLPPARHFRRGDVDGDGRRTVLDALVVLNYLFARNSVPDCLKTADANDDGGVNITDAVALVSLLAGRPSLPEPFPNCGLDPTSDALSCDRSPCG
jgi:hypothetical protein